MKHTKKILPRKLLSILLTVFLLAGLWMAFPVTAYADTAIALKNQINGFNPGPGSTSTLEAFTVTGRPIVYVGGKVTGASNTLNLNIDPGITVYWGAEYSGSTFNSLINLSGGGTFEVAAGGAIKNEFGYAIFATGSNTIKSGGTVISSDSTAIFSTGANAKINITGGTVSAPTNAVGIFTQGAKSSVNISGGTVSGGTAIHVVGANSMLNVSGGTVHGRDGAIYVNEASSSVTVSSGFLFSHSKAIEGNGFGDPTTIAMPNFTSPAVGDAVVCAWNSEAGHTTYAEGTDYDLATGYGATVKWGRQGGKSGILYSNNTFKGFYEMNGVTVKPLTYAVIVNHGTGGGVFEAGATVNIAASAAPAGKAFDKWTATGVTLPSPGSANTSFIMPSKTVTVTATYIDAHLSTNVSRIDTPLETITIQSGKSFAIPFVIYNTVKEIQAPLVWKSSDEQVATVVAGKVTVPANVKSGTTIITATAENGQTLKITVNVSGKAVALNKMTAKVKNMEPGATQKIKIKLTPKNATINKIKFKSNKPRGLYVDKAGNLTAIKRGTYTITVTVNKVIVKKTVIVT